MWTHVNVVMKLWVP